MSHYHAVVWIDHEEAHIIHFTPDEAETLVVRSTLKRQHLHHKRGSNGDGRHSPDAHFFEGVETALNGAGEILIVGPANAKHELMNHMRSSTRQLAGKVVGIEVSDHPTDPQLLAMARRYFKAADRLRQA